MDHEDENVFEKLRSKGTCVNGYQKKFDYVPKLLLLVT